VEAAELIQELLSSRGLSQTELAEIIGVERSFLSRCLRAERMPGRMSCLLLAGFSDSADHKRFWLKHSGVDSRQMALIRRALGIPEVKKGDEIEAALLTWWRDPPSPMEQSVKLLLQRILEAADPAMRD
jgi:transcriptional regulator with XRE-family HTH domain